MANPQKENGYTAIANEILEQIYSLKLNGTQFKILLMIWRYTYGFNRKEHEFSVNFLSSGIGCSERGTQKEVNSLIACGILKVTANPNGNHARVIAFNKNYDEWDEQLFMNNPSPRTVIHEQSFRGRDEQSFRGRDEQSFTQEKKNINKIYKENIYREGESNNIYIINYINSQYTPPLSTSINRWIRFKGLEDEQVSALCELVNAEIEKGYTQTAIASVISDCILEGRKKIYFDRLEAKKNNNGYELMSVKPQDIDDFENFLFRRGSDAP